MSVGTTRSARPRLLIRHLWLLLPFVAIAIRAANPLSDNSFLWHVRAGEAQLAAGEVLRADPFSYTELGTPWRTQSWLAELLYGALFEWTGGIRWVPTMLFIILGLTFVFVGLAVYRWGRDPLITALLLFVITWVAFYFAVPRPVLFSFLLLAVMVVVLQHGTRLAWLIVPLLWLWAAVHGSWVVGAGLVFLEAVRTRSRRAFAALIVGGLATLLTAHGIGTWEVFLSFMENREALTYLSEWARPDFTELVIAPALLILPPIALALGKRRLRLQYLIVIVPFMVFGALQLRSVFPALIVLAPYAAAAVAGRGAPRSAAAGNPRVNATIGLALIALSVVVLARPVRFNESRLPPDDAVAALDDRRVFQGPAAGGYLIYVTWPDRLVFVDDRAELFGAERFESVVAALEGRDYEEMFAEYEVGQVLLESDWKLIDELRTDGWITRYESEGWVVLADPVE